MRDMHAPQGHSLGSDSRLYHISIQRQLMCNVRYKPKHHESSEGKAAHWVSSAKESVCISPALSCAQQGFPQVSHMPIWLFALFCLGHTTLRNEDDAQLSISGGFSATTEGVNVLSNFMESPMRQQLFLTFSEAVMLVCPAMLRWVDARRIF